jgi:hypothetical protein
MNSSEEDESPVPAKKAKGNKRHKYNSEEDEEDDLAGDSEVKKEAQQSAGNIIDNMGQPPKRMSPGQLRNLAQQSDQNLSNN